MPRKKMSGEQIKTPEVKSPEEVLVVARDILFPNGHHEGIRQERLAGILETIRANACFRLRSEVEEDPSWKQIIPYLVFVHQGKVFLMQRTAAHTDLRIANLYSLGIGGHLRRNEMNGQDIFAWAKREFEEEVDYAGTFKVLPLGLLNSEATPIDTVHAGLVLLVEGDSPQISVKDEHKSGRLATLEECEQVFEGMETWSKIVLEALKRKIK